MLTKTFDGGVILSEQKERTANKKIKEIPSPSKVVIPLHQHIGSPNEPIVAPGDIVKIGERIGESKVYVSAPVHSPVSGRVKSIQDFFNPMYGSGEAVIIENDGKDDRFPSKSLKEPDSLSKEELIKIVRESGIVGLGGAAFPTHVKLNLPDGKKVDTLIINGAECEPYLTCDYRLMLEKPKEILNGLGIMAKILGAKKTYIAIEDNKPEAIDAIKKAQNTSDGTARFTKIIVLHTKYPQGAEKQIIKSVLDRVVPSGGLPMDVGCVVQNVGTAYAVYEAVYLGKPLIERVVTITGSCVKEPVNIWVRIGTLLCDIRDSFGGFVREPKKIIFGGPMMGIAQYTMDVPIVKGTSGVIFLSQDEIEDLRESACIRCSRCIEVCPMYLMPTTLMYRVKKENFEEAKKLGIANCFECGACAYVCPAKVPLLDYIKFGKSKIIRM